MSSEENKVLIRRMVQSFNERNLDVLSEFTALDYIDHTHNLRGLEEAKNFINTMIENLDFHISIDDIIAEGDKVWARLTFTGTHIGNFHGIPPTGEKFNEPAVQIFRIANGKVAEVMQVSSEFDLMMKLGIIEYTEKARKIFSGNRK
jgi:predicted ester cyclase